MSAARTKPKAEKEAANSDVARVARRPDGSQVVFLKKSTTGALLSRLEGKCSGSVEDRMNAAMGCQTSEVALTVLAQVIQVHHPNLDTAAPETDIDPLVMASTAMMAEFKPTNVIELMLAAQMSASHRLAMKFSKCALLAGQTPEGTDANTARASRFMRLYAQQAEVFDKLQGRGGQQKVTVEHVTVHQGGQAIVGNIAKGPGGGA